MNSSQKIIGMMICAAVLFLAATPAGLAAPAKTLPASDSAPAPAAAKEPDPAANAVLALIMKSGAQLYYLGNQGGLDGWFILKEGQSQIAYAVPDGQHAVIGAMFMPGGNSVTVSQIEVLLANHPEIKTTMTAAARRSLETERAQLLSGEGVSPDEAEADISSPEMASEYSALHTASVSSASRAPQASSPGELLYKDLASAKGVTVGNNPSMPMMFMVMDPNCPHCQATWRALRDSVFKNTLQIRLIPIGTQDTDGERAAAQLLHVANPLTAWNKYVDGDKTQLAGDPDPSLITSVQANHILVDDWNLHQTPIIVYRGKDGKVKIEQGEPDKVSAMLNDMAVSAASP